MELNFITNIKDCVDLVNNSVPLTLVYYSHLPAIMISLLVGLFVYVKSKSIQSKVLLILGLSFSIWTILDIFLWTSSNSIIYMSLWPIANLLEVIMFVTSFYFLYVYIYKKDLPIILKSFLIILLLPVLFLMSSKYNLTNFDIVQCIPTEGPFWDKYIFPFEIFTTLNILILGVYNIMIKKQIAFLTFGLLSFLIIFTLSGFIIDISGFNYSYELFSFIGMTIFLAMIAFLVVKFKAFDIKLIGAQALVWGQIILIGSQFTFIQSNINKILTGITLVISAIMGLMIVRGVKKEIALREELEIANNNQQALIHFISHQIKGFFTKSKMIFSGLLEGDFGEVNPAVIEMAKTGLASDNNAVAMVQDILGASNLKKGTTDYNFKLVDLTMIVNRIAETFKVEMDKKGLKFETDISTIPLPAMVDETQITQVFKNLMDNSLRYTPSGEIKVSLQADKIDKKKVLFMIKDTGVGLSDTDKSKLFTEGGKGEESLKVNTNSTGYGLYIVKKIVDSHKGRIWAESAGRGHGSKFCVELKLVE